MQRQIKKPLTMSLVTSLILGVSVNLYADQTDINTQNIATNTANIYKNTQDIQQNKLDIHNNELAIEKNQDTITHNAGGIVNGTVIQSNKDLTTGVLVNETSIQNLSGSANANSRKIASNAGKISANSQKIAANTQAVAAEHALNISQQNSISKLQNDMVLLYQDMTDLGEFTADVAAGSIAVSAIDFGTVQAGHYSIGMGIGYASSEDYRQNYDSWAGALGIKYGVGEVAQDVYLSVDAKGWVSSHGNVAVGAGAVLDF